MSQPPLPFTDQRFERATLERWQLDRLNATLARAVGASPFYRSWLPCDHIDALDDLQRLPLLSPSDIGDYAGLLAVGAQQVSRIVSLPTSGSQRPCKRIASTQADLQATVEFFSRGIRCIARGGQATAVLFPADTPCSLGQLIGQALRDIGAHPVLMGIPGSASEGARQLRQAQATSAVGSARVLAGLARWCRQNACELALERVLLSSDNAQPADKLVVADTFGCEVFEHYGMTETGFGIAVDCRAHAGMHMREFDLVVEIIDPATGQRVPDGTQGEVVVTTLSREAMPFVRYRTGDISRIITGPCPCGGTLRRLGRVFGHAIGGTGATAPAWKS